MNNNTTLSTLADPRLFNVNRPFNAAHWALCVGYEDCYNQVLAYTNPEVADLIPLIYAAQRGLGHYVLHLAGLA